MRVQDELNLNASTSSTSSGTNTTSPSGSSGAVTQGGTVGSASQVQTNVDIVTALNMPRVEIDVFSGNPLEYQGFMAVFNDSVDSQPIKDRMKLTRLLQYTSGAAKSAIRNCALIKDGTDAYTKAKDILKKRFGSDHLIVQKVIQDLKSGKPVLKAADMQQLADDLSMAASVLQDMNLMSEVGGQQSLVVNKWKQKALKHIRTTDCYPVFQDFVDFVSDIALDWANPVYGRTGKSVKSHVQKVSQNFTGVVSSQSNVEQCVLCTGKHRVLECVKFREMRPWEHLQAAKAHKLCFNCLLTGHIARECKKPASCSVSDCARKHSTFLHLKSADKPSQVTSGVSGVSAQSETGVNSANGAGDGGASGGVGVVVGNTCAASAGDHSVYMPIGCEQEYIMNTVSHTDLLVSRVVEVNISSADGKYHECLNNVLVVKSIPATYPRSTIDVTRFPHLAGIQFPDIEGGACVDLIIGVDNSHTMIPYEIRRDPSDRNAPFVSLYVLGWCLNGPIPGSSGSRMSVHFTQLERKVKNRWRIENDDVDPYAHSVEDRKVLKLWDRKIYRDSEGHYVLPIPWKDGTPNLPNNKFVAQTRLASLCKGLNRKGMTHTYDSNIRQMITNGYAESVPEAELLKDDGTVWYLPQSCSEGKRCVLIISRSHIATQRWHGRWHMVYE